MKDLVQVAQAHDRTEALCLRDVLMAAGIPATLPEFAMLDVNPFFAFALGGHRILVSASDETEAGEIVRECQSQAAAAPPDLQMASGFLNFGFVIFLIAFMVVPVPLFLRPRSRWLISGAPQLAQSGQRVE